MTKLPHRGGLAMRPRVSTIWPARDLFARIGGRERVARIVDGLYRRIEEDPELKPMFGGGTRGDHARQKMFFEEWMGGEPLFTQNAESKGTRLFHSRMGIDRRKAGRWLQHMTRSLREEGVEPRLIREMMSVLGPMAHGLKNNWGPPLPREAHYIADGDFSALRRLEEAEPGLVSRCQGDSRRVLFKAAHLGYLDLVRFLVDHGTDVSAPSWHDALMVSPWCIARVQGHGEIAAFLEERGAVTDVFDAAYLGDLDRLRAILDADPSMASVEDPALDHLAHTPLRHAVWASQVEAARLLLQRSATVGASQHRLLQRTADRGPLELLQLLLDHGAETRRLEPGPWVLDTAKADLLEAHGADVNHPHGAWLRLCTAFADDDPELIGAILDRGAVLDTRGSEGESALHRAVQAGHPGIVQLLLDRGADVHAVDRRGETPLGCVLFAPRKVDRPALARLLLDHGADPNHPNRQGTTPLARAKASRRARDEGLVEVLDGL